MTAQHTSDTLSLPPQSASSPNGVKTRAAQQTDGIMSLASQPASSPIIGVKRSAAEAGLELKHPDPKRHTSLPTVLYLSEANIEDAIKLPETPRLTSEAEEYLQSLIAATEVGSSPEARSTITPEPSTSTTDIDFTSPISTFDDLMVIPDKDSAPFEFGARSPDYGPDPDTSFPSKSPLWVNASAHTVEPLTSPYGEQQVAEILTDSSPLRVPTFEVEPLTSPSGSKQPQDQGAEQVEILRPNTTMTGEEREEYLNYAHKELALAIERIEANNRGALDLGSFNFLLAKLSQSRYKAPFPTESAADKPVDIDAVYEKIFETKAPASLDTISHSIEIDTTNFKTEEPIMAESATHEPFTTDEASVQPTEVDSVTMNIDLPANAATEDPTVAVDNSTNSFDIVPATIDHQVATTQYTRNGRPSLPLSDPDNISELDEFEQTTLKSLKAKSESAGDASTSTNDTEISDSIVDDSNAYVDTTLSSVATQTTPFTTTFKSTQTVNRSVSTATQVGLGPLVKWPSYKEIYMKDVELVRRPQPFVPSVNVISLKTRLREQKPTTAPAAARASTHTSNVARPTAQTGQAPAKTVETISLLDSDDEDNTISHDRSSFLVGGASGDPDFYQGNGSRPIASGESDFYRGDGYGSIADMDNGNTESESDYDMDAESNVRDQQREADCYRALNFLGIENHSLATLEGRAAAVNKVRYQDMDAPNFGKFPSPATGHGLNYQKYLFDVRSKLRKNPSMQINRILRDSIWSDVIQDDQTSYQTEWPRAGYSLIKGLPTVEEIEFIVPHNRAQPDGDCYWRAVAFQIYGTDEMWGLAKAEHLTYFHHVLENERHPRHDMYTKNFNSKFFDTSSPVAGGQFKANMYQTFFLAHTWTPALTAQVTADLYNICVYVFSFKTNTRVASEVAVRGTYNSRHIAMAFMNDNHFAPMIPNLYDPWEFKMPRITAESTAAYTHAPKPTSTLSTQEHRWRNEFTKIVPPPVPRAQGCDVNQLRTFMGTRHH